jgi:hypothetical protein
MKLSADLNEFNRRFAEVLLPSFPAGIVPMEDAYGMLCFRGAVPNHDNPKHIGTHVAVTLEEDVIAALNIASPAEREDITRHLIESLGAAIRIQYDPNRIGLYALDIVGTMESVRAR